MKRSKESLIVAEDALRISKAIQNWKKLNILIGFERIIHNLRGFAEEREESRYTLQSYTEVRSRSWCRIPENSISKAIFDLFASISYFISAFTATFYVFFLNSSKNQLPSVHSKVTEALILADFLLRSIFQLFLVSLYKSKLTNSEKAIKVLEMLPEFLALFPFYLISTNLVWLRLFRILTINRLITWIEESYITKRYLSEVLIKDEYLRKSLIGLKKFIILVTITCHLIACIWYYITTVEDYSEDWMQDRYSGRNNKFMASLYWTTVTFTSVGYGDITPKTVPEYIFTMVIQFLGIMFFAYLMGNVNTYIANIYKRQNAIFKRENDLDKWIFELDRNYPERVMPPNIQKEIRAFYKFQWENDDTFIDNFNEFMAKLPSTIKHEVNIYVYKSRIEYLGPFMVGISEVTIYDLAANMKPKLENQAVEILKKGSKSKYFFVIKSGHILIAGEEPFLRLSPRSYFGESCVIFNDKSDFQYVTDTECTLFSIHRSVFSKIPKNDFRILALRAFRRNKYFHMVNKQYYMDDSECDFEEAIEEFNIFSDVVDDEEIQEFETKLNRGSKESKQIEDKYIQKIRNLQELQYRKLMAFKEEVEKIKEKLNTSEYD